MIMDIKAVNIDSSGIAKLLGAANPDAALLYLFVEAGNRPETAQELLRFSQTRLASASALLRQLGLWHEERLSRIPAGERPAYSERDVLSAMDSDMSFRGLTAEIQRVLGRAMNTEELKILLGFIRYLGLPAEVVITLVHFCRDRTRQKGAQRNPSLRAIEKEAYIWAENGIDTLEEAAAYIQNQNIISTQIRELMETLQIRGRNLTQAEEKYARKWLESGFDRSAIAMAYERTCLNIGTLNWSYMDKILMRWKEQGLLTGDAVSTGDNKTRPGKAASGPRRIDDDEQAAILHMMEGQ